MDHHSKASLSLPLSGTHICRWACFELVRDPHAQRWWDAEEVDSTTVVLLTDSADEVVGTGTLTTLDDRLGVGNTGTLSVTDDRVGVGSTGTLTVTEENDAVSELLAPEDERESEVLVATETVPVPVLELDGAPPGTNRHFCAHAAALVQGHWRRLYCDSRRWVGRGA